MNYKDKVSYNNDDIFYEKYQYDPLYTGHFFVVFILYFCMLSISIILLTIEILLSNYLKSRAAYVHHAHRGSIGDFLKILSNFRRGHQVGEKFYVKKFLI